MLAKPTTPMVPTLLDVRLRQRDSSIDGPLFQGWGVRIFDNRIL